MTELARKRSLLALTATSAQVVAGATTALLPIAVQAVAARGLSLESQAVLALSISIGGFISALLTSTVLETRLAGFRSRPQSFIPAWSTCAGILGSIALAATPIWHYGALLGTPLLMVALSLSRMHGIIAHRWRTEIHAGAVMVLGAVISMVLMDPLWQAAVTALAVCSVYTIGIRAFRQPFRSVVGPPTADYVKVGAETAVTAAVPLILNVMVFALLSPPAVVAFRMTLSVLGILQPVLGFMRTRLLVSKSASLIVALSAASAVALSCVVIAHCLGIFGAILGGSWDQVSLTALVTACLWKAASVPATMPFATLRRTGNLSALLRLRAIVSTLFLICAAVALVAKGTLLSVFMGLLIAEAIGSVLYYVAAKRESRRSTPRKAG